MEIGDNAKSILIRGLLFWFVISALRPARRSDGRGGQARPDQAWTSGELAPAMQPSFSHASFGFLGSLAVMIVLMVALAGPVSVTAPEHTLVGLRGTI